MAQPSPRGRPRISANPTFTIVIVGEKETKFVVHEGFLTHYSDYFRAALQRGFKEAETKTVTLKEEHSATFELFVHWVYHQRFPDASEGDDGQLVELFSDNFDS
ncbi:hypothetical protein BU23DRAFT_573000 [Bimuria novae-zelandiae CBS 107.79]|uniref:BTB domain-containing protein n=1 Tax=Bimuria novae-zelandiae CBS 107.79 TaxID=1447943 RepID=A0A6A5URW0_9PLEO|nr:hypothetical protein BU23DRAFT_573000 [Bimuria novae-zelandiae CBS 107.79]